MLPIATSVTAFTVVKRWICFHSHYNFSEMEAQVIVKLPSSVKGRVDGVGVACVCPSKFGDWIPAALKKVFRGAVTPLMSLLI